MSLPQHSEEYNCAALEAYQIRAVARSARHLVEELLARGTGESEESAQEAFDLGILLEISDQRLTSVAGTLAQFSH